MESSPRTLATIGQTSRTTQGQVRKASGRNSRHRSFLPEHWCGLSETHWSHFDAVSRRNGSLRCGGPDGSGEFGDQFNDFGGREKVFVGFHHFNVHPSSSKRSRTLGLLWQQQQQQRQHEMSNAGEKTLCEPQELRYGKRRIPATILWAIQTFLFTTMAVSGRRSPPTPTLRRLRTCGFSAIDANEMCKGTRRVLSRSHSLRRLAQVGNNQRT